MLHAEVGWFAHRAAWHLIYAGVFERHPGLKFVLTEVSTGWVPATFAQLDATTPGTHGRLTHSRVARQNR